MDNYKKFLEIYEYACNRQYHIDGLFCVGVLLYCVYEFFHIIPVDSNQYNQYIVSISYIMLFIGWYKARLVPKFSKGKIGILLYQKSSINLKSENQNIVNDIRMQLKQSNYSKLFEIKFLPDNIIISDIETAHYILFKSQCYLLIWGEYSCSKYNNEEMKGFQPGKLNFTYSVPKNSNFEEYRSDVTNAIAGRKWFYKTSNEFLERDFVIKNVVHVSKYIIANCLINFGNLAIGRDILKEIFSEKGYWVKSSEVDIHKFIINITDKISMIDFLEAKYLYEKFIYVNEDIFYNDAISNQIIALCDSSFKLFPRPNSLSLKAIALFTQNEINKSRQALVKLKNMWPSNPESYISLGFLFFYTGNFKSGITQYNKGIKYATMYNNEVWMHVINFTQSILKREGDKTQYYYIIGILYFQIHDYEKSKNNFKLYLEKEVRTTDSVKSMITKSNQFIKRIELIHSNT